MWRKATLGVLAGVAILVLPVAVSGQTPPIGPPVTPPSPTLPKKIGTLATDTPILPFSGAVQNPTPLPLVNSPVPLVCAAECQEFSFVAATDTPFLVSIKNNITGPNGSFNANDGFDLYLYGPSGSLVDAKNGIGANGEALSVQAPTPGGTYTIVVTFTYAEDTNANYTGEVRLEKASTWKPAPCVANTTVGTTTGCFFLPQLTALPAYDLHVDGLPPVASTPLGFPFPVAVSTPTSCYLDESIGLDSPSLNSIQNPVTRCLRFTSDIQDTGSGPLEVELPWLTTSGGSLSSGFVPGQCQAQQVLVDDKGDQATRPAGDCEFHPEHAHFHYKNLVSFTLYTVSNGVIGSPVATSLKESFCLSDDDYFGFATAGPNGPRNFVGQPGCNVPSEISADGAEVTEGVSPGWGDVYTWDTPDQFIDISSVPPGTYALVERTNPDSALLVAGPRQTCAVTMMTLKATAVTQGSTLSSCP
jgi:hypothetical protein